VSKARRRDEVNLNTALNFFWLINSTKAEPTITPSAHCAASLAWEGLEMPKPTAMGSLEYFLMRATNSGKFSASFSRLPVIPATEIK